jgi:predicted transcriptional regulator
MGADRANELRAFRQFIDKQLANGGPEMTLDDALTSWEAENETDRERDETLHAIERGLDDIRAGRTVDAFESAERLRQKIESIAER